MNFIYLKTFLTVCELGNFTEAAKHLFVPQPTVSNRMKSLEETLGKELFLKGRRGKRVVELTEAGEIFFPYAKQIIETMDTVKEKINSSSSSQTILKIGSSIPPAHPLLFNYIKELENTMEFVSIDVVTKESEMIHLLNEEALNLAFVSDPLMDKHLECHLMKNEEIELIVSANHPLATSNCLEDLSQLEKENEVIYTPFKNHLDRTELSKIKYQKQLMTNSFEVIRKLIIDNKWISFLPSPMMENEIARGDMVQLTIHKKFYVDSMKYFIVYRKNEENEKLYTSILKKLSLTSEYFQSFTHQEIVN